MAGYVHAATHPSERRDEHQHPPAPNRGHELGENDVPMYRGGGGYSKKRAKCLRVRGRLALHSLLHDTTEAETDTAA